MVWIQLIFPAASFRLRRAESEKISNLLTLVNYKEDIRSVTLKGREATDIIMLSDRSFPALDLSNRVSNGVYLQHLMQHLFFWWLRPFMLLTLGCGWTSGVGSGAFGVGSVSAASVATGVGGGTGTLGQTGSQGRQGRQGRWHTLVVIRPGNTEDF